MQDQDAPPVEEGEIGGGVVVVPVEAIPAAVAADAPDAISSMAAFTAHPWTTAIGRPWPAVITVRDPDASGPAFRRTTLRPTRSHCRYAKTRPRAFSALWTTCSSRRRFRKPPASSTLKLSS